MRRFGRLFGLTANPALGAAVDLLVHHGGIAILSETPEIYGAEHLLTRRAATPEIGQKIVDALHWWEDYTARNRGVMNNNPSPGNKAGGLTTILEKSLGATAKGGTTTLRGIFSFAEPVTAQGFVFHYTLTSASWLNAGEGFFAKLAKRRLKRGVFRSIVDLQAAINRFLADTNHNPYPFVWTADPDKIIAAVRRGHQVLDSIH